ncbi:MAG: riboflavin synthase [Flavobacteriaceae bacterium]|jgi:riboflavin synthase|nr:riboflavin synthase [Flavobacteriaceae bacterium]MBT3753915.1 riboflavin synthase [Flavobacteriaceae bacterium]MBT3794588.1 riboflavin synthase [Flavobacteriaceae bacterium]MBT4062502.1 riboflavin synthase [Flavobacteriaceae bacterium]MBT4414960.1 riboflavin synthase [Flavobacteriaceae bacterium]
MFTGIIEDQGIVLGLEVNRGNLNITLSSKLTSEFKIDQSVSHNGICLTIVEIKDNAYTVTAIKETIAKTNIGKWQIGEVVNLERAMIIGARLDGHMIQGHIDQVGECFKIDKTNGSWEYTFQYNPSDNLTVEKGSIAVNGISLTVVQSDDNSFSVAIIPYTYNHTNFQNLTIGSVVNLEFDVLGKYLAKMLPKYK